MKRALLWLGRWLISFSYLGDDPVAHDLAVRNNRLWWENSRLKIENVKLRLQLRAIF